MISFIVATSGRPTLEGTLRSIECWPGDEILVVGENVQFSDSRAKYLPCSAGNDWGHTERNFAMPLCKGQYVAHIDDDDEYALNHRVMMAGMLLQHPGKSIIFCMKYKSGEILWRDKEVRVGNVGTPMTLLPNDPARLGQFGSWYGGDIHYVETFAGNSGYTSADFVWCEDVTVLVRPKL